MAQQQCPNVASKSLFISLEARGLTMENNISFWKSLESYANYQSFNIYDWQASIAVMVFLEFLE